MASVQVMPNSVASSRKQGHLEAGKKKLEEFRKKKAAKKAASTIGQLQSGDADQIEKPSQNNEHVRDGTTSVANGIAITHPSGTVADDENKASNSAQGNGIYSSNGMHANSIDHVEHDHATHGEFVQQIKKDDVSKLYGSSGLSELANGYYDHWRENEALNHDKESKLEPTFGIATDQHFGHPVHMKPSVDGSISHASFHSPVESQLSGSRNSTTIYVHDPAVSGVYHMSTLPESSESASVQNRLGDTSTSANSSAVYGGSTTGVEQSIPGSSMDGDSALGSNIAGGKIADAISRRLSAGSAPWHASDLSSANFSSALKSSSYQPHFPSAGYGATFGRSRPSFLDSIGVSRFSSTSQTPYGELEKATPPVSSDESKLQSMQTHSPSSLQPSQAHPNIVEQSLMSRTPDSNSERGPSMSSSAPLNDGQLLKQQVADLDMPMDYKLPTLKKDEDFAALEQHIEDLTQEKFSLQRALDTAQTLAESLASENSSLTDSYNQQGKVVNQLKSDMERLQGEIKAQLLVLESIKMEYANAQLECNAADERAKILASEVISLEEKALRLRSNELKLEKQLENLNSDITSYKRKVSSLEKERQDFQSTIDALREEKKLLLSRLRKASVDGKVDDIRKSSSNRRDASTSTEDLDEHVTFADGETSVPETAFNSGLNALPDTGPSMASSSSTSNFLLHPEESGFNLPDASGDIPQDQLRMIDNINSLVSELAVEKEELVRALRIESSNCTKLKELNKDLSQKLETQTQRLELMTAQRMANENVLAKPIDAHGMHDSVEYADEGDEVVERVLGWIMKLFPGGPAKRRTSKLL